MWALNQTPPGIYIVKRKQTKDFYDTSFKLHSSHTHNIVTVVRLIMHMKVSYALCGSVLKYIDNVTPALIFVHSDNF